MSYLYNKIGVCDLYIRRIRMVEWKHTLPTANPRDMAFLAGGFQQFRRLHGMEIPLFWDDSDNVFTCLHVLL